METLSAVFITDLRITYTAKLKRVAADPEVVQVLANRRLAAACQAPLTSAEVEAYSAFIIPGAAVVGHPVDVMSVFEDERDVVDFLVA